MGGATSSQSQPLLSHHRAANHSLSCLTIEKPITASPVSPSSSQSQPLLSHHRAAANHSLSCLTIEQPITASPVSIVLDHRLQQQLEAPGMEISDHIFTT
uniref:Uncharacterized protein n=1 Tax=Knipowitschia caucasica TaxID=637954 RepID=A0AAV2JJE1_KNICA